MREPLDDMGRGPGPMFPPFIVSSSVLDSDLREAGVAW
jgi:hypothetical protein